MGASNATRLARILLRLEDQVDPNSKILNWESQQKDLLSKTLVNRKRRWLGEWQEAGTGNSEALSSTTLEDWS